MDYKKELQELGTELERMKLHYFSEKGRQQQLLETERRLDSEQRSLMESLDILDEVRLLLQHTSEYAREQSRQQIEMLVTNCLQYIFDSTIEFKIDIHEVRGKPEAEFYVVSSMDGIPVRTKPQEARGGGVVDIISLALRIAMLQCSNPEINGPILLDEPAKHVSDDYIVQVAEFLKQVSVMFDRQIIMVTHNRHLSEIADRWYRVEMNNGISSAATDS